MHDTAMGKYREINLLTADPSRMIVMSYELAIRSFRAARDHYEAREYEAKAQALQRALGIVAELDAALDFTKGGEIARNLHALYCYIQSEALGADLRRDFAAFDGFIAVLEELKGAWVEIGAARKKTAAAPAAYPAARPAAAAGGRAWNG